MVGALKLLLVWSAFKTKKQSTDVTFGVHNLYLQVFYTANILLCVRYSDQSL